MNDNKWQNDNKRNLLKWYLLGHKRSGLLYLTFILIFSNVFYLYGIDLFYVWYPASVCGLLWAIVLFLDFRKFRKNHMERRKIVEHIDVTLENLPPSESLMEADYQTMIRRLTDEKNGTIQELVQKQQELQEYITLWSHQMKTPITAMGLLLQSMSREDSEMLGQQLFEVERYVDTVLQYLRLDSMNSDLLLQEYDLSDMIRQGVKYHSRSFISKKISLQMDDFNIKVITDEKWFVFVLKQILSNALKYTQKGSIRIYMEENQNFHKETILVIEDTGIGIKQEDIPRIFERGFTGYNGRMDQRATGIGLYLSKQILDRLQHRIWIESVVGVGTKVHIDLSNLTKM